MLRKLAFVMLIALCLSASLNVMLYFRLWEYEDSLSALRAMVNKLSLENARMSEELNILRQGVQFQYHPTDASPEGQWIYVVGVASLETGYAGEVMTVYARFVEGSGRVFIATTPKIGIDLQASAETAFMVAQEIAGVESGNIDCMLTVASNRTIDVLDGPSAGAALTVLLTMLFRGKQMRRDVILTGTVQHDGSIGQVGGIIEKAMAAATIGAKTFLIPKGQSNVVVYVEKVVQIGRMKIITYQPLTVNVQEYLKEKGYSIEVVEVANVFEALRYFEA